MPGFTEASDDATGLSSWQGCPDDHTAHRAILAWLQKAVTSGFLDVEGPVSNRVKGNLGEFIAYNIGETYVFTNVKIKYTANASTPLSEISRPDIDIVWLYFGNTPADDWTALQEVKTTGEASLRLADRLITDYDKLFGEKLQLTLQTHLGALKNRLEQQGHGQYCSRITALGGPSPDQARGIRILPTLLHDAAHDSSAKMAVIRQALIGKGWTADAVRCWSVALGDIDHRLTRLARGQL